MNKVAAREQEWLSAQRLVQSIPNGCRKRLVAHRGYHCASASAPRPLENTLEAYRDAWSMGLQLTECDVALTRDGALVLLHDETLARVAAPGVDPVLATTPASSLTAEQLRSVPLCNGSRVPLLTEVLECASGFGPRARLVVEIKPHTAKSPRSAAVALASLLRANPDLAAQVAVVMSFDLDEVHRFRARFPAQPRGRPANIKALFLTAGSSKNEFGVFKYFDPRVELGPGGLSPRVRAWLARPGSKLDGLYIRHPGGPDATRVVAELSRQCSVGVWGVRHGSPQGDSYASFSHLRAAGARYINSDLPSGFLGDGRGRIARPGGPFAPAAAAIRAAPTTARRDGLLIAAKL